MDDILESTQIAYLISIFSLYVRFYVNNKRYLFSSAYRDCHKLSGPEATKQQNSSKLACFYDLITWSDNINRGTHPETSSRNDPGVWLAYSDSTRRAEHAHICETSERVANSEIRALWSLKFWSKIGNFRLCRFSRHWGRKSTFQGLKRKLRP